MNTFEDTKEILVGKQRIRDNDPVATFLQDLGYRVEPTEWNIDELPQGAQRFIRRFRLMCHYPDSVSPFQVFHIELQEDGAHYRAIRPVLDPFCRTVPQGSYLFVFSPPGRGALTLINPKPASSLSTQVRYRTLRFLPGKLGSFQNHIIESLRLFPGEQDAEYIAEKHRRTFDELQRLRRRRSKETSDDIDLLQLFCADLQAYPVLSSDEQLQLVQQAHSDGPGSCIARDKLIAHNLRLVIYVAGKFRGRGLDFLDLIQQGTLGLRRAVDRFRLDRGTRFSTYAVHWIKQAIQRALIRKGRMVSLPVDICQRLNHLERTAKFLRDEFNREPTNLELALKANLLPPQETALGWLSLVAEWDPTPSLIERLREITKEVACIRRWGREPISLDLPLSNGEAYFNHHKWDEVHGDDITVADVIPTEEDFIWDLESSLTLKQQVQTILASLSSDKGAVLEMRFGLKEGQKHTLEKICRYLQISPGRVRDILSPRILRDRIYSRGLQDQLALDFPIEHCEQNHQEQADEEDVPEIESTCDSHCKYTPEQWLALTPPQRWAEIVTVLRVKPGDSFCFYPPVSIDTYLNCLEETLEPDEQELFYDY